MASWRLVAGSPGLCTGWKPGRRLGASPRPRLRLAALGAWGLGGGRAGGAARGGLLVAWWRGRMGRLALGAACAYAACHLSSVIPVTYCHCSSRPPALALAACHCQRLLSSCAAMGMPWYMAYGWHTVYTTTCAKMQRTKNKEREEGGKNQKHQTVLNGVPTRAHMPVRACFVLRVSEAGRLHAHVLRPAPSRTP
jgi:hypothetical protein